ncbi:hypothetical protein scyTo_0017628 [Scyliorhinus torazame]|uniref:UPAR/Ly6 domain-containing protein n=1 Tax=Scyliorhinus torazame TaxID=75743 RepID=A0A401PWV4_SCYTO|nr:hypothetical protein [Scyliorhinus torazame]
METVICNANEKCYKKVGKIRKNLISSRGCTAQTLCEKTHVDEFAGLRVTLRTLCCDNNLCNGSKDVKMPLATASVLLFGWLICFL